mmetsp:Transcript_14694/g.25013  ORF Transcript_14694/g.25013 Transcript_14694/m.25013 type:complete len:176 (-) Transcript_14694:261-788(-)
MGGCASSKETSMDLNKIFHTKKLREPWSDDYQNTFEKEIYYAINIFRSEPSLFIGPVGDLKTIMSEEFGKSKELIKAVQKELATMKPLSPVTFDKLANKACQLNNKEKIGKEQVEKGGNVETFTNMEENKEMSTQAEEDTVFNWSKSAQYLIAFILLSFFKEQETKAEQPEGEES